MPGEYIIVLRILRYFILFNPVKPDFIIESPSIMLIGRSVGRSVSVGRLVGR